MRFSKAIQLRGSDDLPYTIPTLWFAIALLLAGQRSYPRRADSLFTNRPIVTSLGWGTVMMHKSTTDHSGDVMKAASVKL
jgi:hypothetical protein